MRLSRPRDNYKEKIFILRKGFWTQEEIDFIKNNWEQMDDKVLALKLDRTFRATKAKRFDLGLIRKKYGVKHNIDEVKKIFEDKGYVLLTEEYKNNHQKLEYICLKHNEKGVQHITLSSIIHNGCGCYYCGLEKAAKSKMHPNEYYINWCNNNDFTYVERTIRNHQTYIGFYCNKHKDNGIQYKSITNIEKGTGCIFCNTFKTEQEVGKILDKYNINYVKQKRFTKCKSKYTLPFDYYLPKYNIAIEYDGEQHFKPVRFNGTSEETAKEMHEECKYRDNIKNNYCKENNILLIRIPYYEKDNMESFIIENLKKGISLYN